MKIGIYSPYLDTLGGGERYVLTFAEYCLAKNWDVELFWGEGETIGLAVQRFNLNLTNLKLNSDIYKSFSKEASYFDKIKRSLKLRSYDLIFYLSDGSIPTLNAKQNWLHFQTPFQVNGINFLTQQKLTKINRIICNSKFTKKFIDKSFGIKSEIIYPPISTADFSINTNHKQNIILSVGRFDQIQNAKRQDILIEVFKNMIDKGLKEWKLVLAGGSLNNESDLIKLRELAINYPIEFKVNIDYKEIINLYQQSSIYWHATGYEVDEQKNSEKVEHFGISVVEAMSASCISIVYEAGGLNEIITDKENGYFWKNKDQLEKITTNVIKNVNKEEKIITNALNKVQRFSKIKFFKELEERLS